jgi:7-cyano-7-deazaguanine synthase
MKKRALILLAGGLDSTTCLAIAMSQGYECYALSFNYGQKHNAEIEAAKKIAKIYHVVSHEIFPLQAFGGLGSSALTDANIPVPDYKGDGKIPATYVPARNTIFLSIATGIAEILKIQDIFIGSNILDYSGYPDCRPEYFTAFEKMANLATKAGIEEKSKLQIHAPLVKLSKAEIIKWGMRLGIDYSITVSCYRADHEGRACGTCDSCTYRKKGFRELGITDPTRYFSKETA